MTDLAQAIVVALRRRAGRERIRVGVFYRGGPAVLRAILAEGHVTAVAGDRFRALFAVAEQLGAPGRRPFSIVEARFDALPFRPGSLDALVLTRGLPAGGDPEATLASLKPFLAPGGAVVVPHPVTDGRLGRFARPLALGTQPPYPRHVLCASAMAAGFKEVSQTVPPGRGLVSWIVTAGVVGRA